MPDVSPPAVPHAADNDSASSTSGIASGGRPAAMFWTVVAAFATYFCIYGFRKPFTAGDFDSIGYFGFTFKELLVIAQVLGYMASKFIGIKVISELRPEHRIRGLVAVVMVGFVVLAGLPLIPPPLNLVCLFVNGMAMGMTFGMVLAYLEGRRCTEALAAGLCTSFILADGVTKSVGSWLLDRGVPELWMPLAAGGLFLLPLFLSVAMLSRVPPPDLADQQARSVRDTLTRQQRRELYGRYALGLSLLVLMYLLVTVLRSMRADFAPQLWQGLLGVSAAPSAYARSEFWVALGVMLLNGGAVFIASNRTAFFVSLATCLVGFVAVGLALLGWASQRLDAFGFMVLIGLGLYLPYVAIHTTVFERLLAMTRERGNLGFLLYVADAFAYLGYVGVMIARVLITPSDNLLDFFIQLCWWAMAACGLSVLAAWWYFVPVSRHALASGSRSES